ncbi:MAG: 6-phosphogluconolactonase [Coxiellaceae bacterium]|nr:6-phosphogluconolactonase [Coxiellaceae bacterium]
MDSITLKNNILTIFLTENNLFQFAANDFSKRAITAINNKGVFSVALSGGNTPKLFFDALANNEQHKKNIPWEKIKFFFGDERYVAADSIDSNYHTAMLYLFSKVAVNPNNIYRIPTDFEDPKEAAKAYEDTLKKNGPIDLIYLGLGDDAHTASLMPFSEVVKNISPDTLVESLFVKKLNMSRITLTPAAINHCEAIIFLVTGDNKAAAVKNVLQGVTDPQQYPAQLIHCEKGKTIWYLDQAAAKTL